MIVGIYHTIPEYNGIMMINTLHSFLMNFNIERLRCTYQLIYNYKNMFLFHQTHILLFVQQNKKNKI